MPSRIGDAQIEVGGFTNIAVGAQMTDCRQVIALVGTEQIVGIAPENLSGALQEQPLWGRDDAREGQAGVVDSVLAAHQVPGHEWAIGPREHVIMKRVHLAEGGAHLACS
jgi:hypothetical protein